MIDPRFYIKQPVTRFAELLADLDVSLPETSPQTLTIENVAALATSQAGDLSFLTSGKHKSDLETAKAAVCLIEEKHADLAQQAGIIPVISAHPRAHFARITARLFQERRIGPEPEISATATIHDTAIISAGAKISAGVHVGPYSIIGPGVEIGAGSHIDAHIHISCTLMGENCHVKSGAVIGGAGFGVAYDEQGSVNIPHVGRVVMGNNVTIGSQTCIDRGQLGDTVIADNVKIDNLVQIAHNVELGDGCIIAGHSGVSGSCKVGKGVLMGGNVGLADHIHVGDGAQIAARAGVMHNIPAGEIWSGIPAQPIRDHMRMVSAMRKLTQKPKG